MPIISICDLVKEYRTPKRYPGKFGALRTLFTPEYVVKRAVDHINLQIEQGEIIGYIGPNGAGKSTMIKMLTGILAPTSGTIEVAGFVPYKQRKKNALNIGVVFGQRSQLWWDVPLIESFKLIAKMYNIPDAQFQHNLSHFVDLLEMDKFIETPVRQLSLGQRMRGDFVAAMLYEPPILYLDEPTVGLDIFAKERIREFIEEINRSKGTTVILTTHDFQDVERLCQRIVMVDQGRVIYDGSISTLKERSTKRQTLAIQLQEEEASVEIAGANIIRREGTRLWLEYDPHMIAVGTLITEICQRYAVINVSVAEIELEAIIREIYENF